MKNKVGLGSKKELNAELNLTPFIDLLSTCVCFLLITAVWIEIGTVEIKQSHGTEAAASKKESYDLDLVYKDPTHLRVNLKRNGKRVKGFKVESQDSTSLQAALDQTIKDKVLNYKNKIIDIATATITPRTTVQYGQLVETLDTLRSNKILNIGVLSARGQ
ncbi:MAG: biopolymer transporter ExbD [Bdellovibrionota bacterium]|nr:biopolymer transporter ExbD [Bdellovibrionota bacterium]